MFLFSGHGEVNIQPSKSRNTIVVTLELMDTSHAWHEGKAREKVKRDDNSYPLVEAAAAEAVPTSAKHDIATCRGQHSNRNGWKQYDRHCVVYVCSLSEVF